MRIAATPKQLVIACALALLWAFMVLWAVPALIRGAYAGESLPILNRLIEGQAHTPVESIWGSGGAWRGMLRGRSSPSAHSRRSYRISSGACERSTGTTPTVLARYKRVT